MPDISASLGLLDATFFLYPSVEDAKAGTAFGGSGVVVGLPLKSRPDLFIRYAVTNWHVAVSLGASVIRLSLPGGGTHVIEHDPSEWTFLPGKQDIAAIPLVLPNDILPAFVPSNLFITDSETSDAHVGDDIFMVGRFVDFDGRETNKPATRFGSVSMVDAPIQQPTGFRGRSIIADMHCRSGFSGSPVYVYRPGGTAVFTQANFSKNSIGFDPVKRSYRKWGIGNDVNVRLLGILWGQFPEAWEIKSPPKSPLASATLVTEGAYVQGFSGMSCIIPAIDILTLLDQPKLRYLYDAMDTFAATSGIPVPQ